MLKRIGVLNSIWMICLAAPGAWANVSDTVCTIPGTTISFDLGTGSPPVSGSRVFYQIDFFATQEAAEAQKPALEIGAGSKDFRVVYRDTSHDWRISIYDRKSKKKVFSAQVEFVKKPGSSGVTSKLPGLEAQGKLDCPS